MRRQPLAERFWKYVDKSGDCWIWTGGKSEGYGMIRTDAPERKMKGAHRISYILAHGEIPDGKVIDHRCHDRACVNPDHLRAVTSKQNAEHKQGPHRNNKSGYLGVYEYFPGRWRGRVRHFDKYNYTQPFGSPEEAADATKALRLLLFSHNDVDRKSA